MSIRQKWGRAALRAAGASLRGCVTLVRPAPLGAKERARAISARHDAQTLDQAIALQRKYEAPVFGEVSLWSLIEKLAQCVDPSDERLGGASQQVHVLQMLEAMEADGGATPDFQLAAILHDLGKVLLLTDEAPENVIGMNNPVGHNEPGAGLRHCTVQWNHDEFAYSRLKAFLPDHIAWLVRYHSIQRSACVPFMDAHDREYLDRYLRPFARYDHGTKSPHAQPRKRIEDYRHIVEAAMPATIVF